MNRLKGLVGSSQASSVSTSHNGSMTSLAAADETAQMKDAMLAALHIMNDDMESAQKSLEQGSSSYHILGKGIVTFLRAIIGSEQDSMKEASQRLAEAESVSSESRARSERDPNAFRSQIYPPGTEHALCCAEAQIMSAAVAVLNENVFQALKGFYKMRKAYLTLDSIAGIEREYLKTHGHEISSRTTSLNGRISANGSAARKAVPYEATNDDTDDDDGDDFYDAADEKGDGPTKEYLGRLETNGEVDDRSSVELEQTPRVNMWAETSVRDEAAVKALITHPIDVFIQSGTSLHYGIILLMLSLIPPAFARLLSVIGFRGDRKRGLDLLWRASTVRDNINGCIAALFLTGFYNGLITFLDILPPGAYPKERCDTLMFEMREIYPNSRFWYLQEARSYSAEKDLERAVAMLEKVENEDCKLRQVEALQWFDKGLDLMFMHDYARCSVAFHRCIELNGWSHGFYYYLSACCHIELYRLHSSASSSPLAPAFSPSLEKIIPDASLAAKHANKATEILTDKVPNLLGKKKLMGRQLPFDAFVLRKLAKWKARTTTLGCTLVDAVGVSPLEEMIFFWGGYGRMRHAHMHDSLVRLAWSDGGAAELLLPEHAAVPLPPVSTPALASCGDADENAALAVLRATIYRHRGRPDLARRAVAAAGLQERNATSFRGLAHAESWPAPAARYELAVAAWVEAGGSTGADAASEGSSKVGAADEKRKKGAGDQRTYDMDKLVECSKLLEEAAAWDSFDLDSRFGIKISTGRETLKALGVANGRRQ